MKRFVLVAVATAGLATLGPDAAEACPDISEWGATFAFTGDDLRSGWRRDVTAGGSESVPTPCRIDFANDGGSGCLTTSPDFTFDLQRMRGHRLKIAVVSECDPVLLVNTGAENWYFDDDDNPDSSLDPVITLGKPSNGYLDVWVGTYDGRACDAELELATY